MNEPFYLSGVEQAGCQVGVTPQLSDEMATKL